MALKRANPVVSRRLLAISRQMTRLAQLWADDLRAVVPDLYQRRWGRALGLSPRLVVEVDENGSCREMPEPGSSPDHVSIVARATARLLALRIDEASTLRRRLSLPSGVATRLDTALNTNLPAWTPFDREDVYATAVMIDDAEPRQGAALVEIRCAPRSFVDARVEALRAKGLEPDLIELGDGRFELPRATRKRFTLQRRKLVLIGLGLLLIGQGSIAYAILMARQSDEIDALKATRAEIVGSLRRHASAEKEMAARRDRGRRLAQRMTENASLSHGLHVIAEALPKDAVIREFEASRERAEGHATILGPATLDVVDSLSRTGFYHVGDITVLPGDEAARKVFSTGFRVTPWVQVEGRSVR